MLLDIIFIQLYISPTRTQSLLNQIEFCGAFYLYVLYSLQRGIFHYLLKLFDCHIGFFCSALWLQISLSDELHKHSYLPNTNALSPAFFSSLGLNTLTKIAHNKHLSFQFFAHCNAKLFFENFLFLRSCS